MNRVRRLAATGIGRSVLMYAGVAGLIALSGDAVTNIGTQLQHCEPLVRR